MQWSAKAITCFVNRNKQFINNVQILMNVMKTQVAVVSSAPIQLDHTYVAATLAIGLLQTDSLAMV